VLQKWVVGNRMRMGIFALNDIDAGAELTFDYNFEVYGYFIFLIAKARGPTVLLSRRKL
jgi:hypothetical protein